MKHLLVDVGTQLVQHRFGPIVQELVGIGHIVNVDSDERRHWRFGPPAKRLCARFQRQLTVDDDSSKGGESECDQHAEQQQT